MFIPLASTTSTSSSPSPSTSPLDDGITTVKYYIYIHTNLNPRTHDTTKTFHCNWQDNIKCQSHCIYTSTCPYRCCPEMCRYCRRGNSYSQRGKIDLYARTSEKDIEGGIQGIYKSPFSWDTISAECPCWNSSTSRGPHPSFVTYPNYYDGQFHHYYPPNSTPQSPTTSVPTTTQSAGMNASQTSTKTSATSTTATTTSPSSSNTIPTVAREAHRSHTVFAPMTLVESLTKTNLLLVADMKSEIQSIHNELSTIPFEEIRNKQSQAFGKVNDKIETLEKNFTELKDIVMKRSYQNFKMDPKLLDQWNPSMLVIRRSPWTNMRLILNKVASDNIADLFPSDWAPKPCFSDIQEKHFKVLSEVMTAMFYQCGILQDYDVLAIQGYEQFLKALHHHMVMGNVTITQLGQFLILMTYMSFCRIGHYTDYMREEDAINLEIAA